MLDEMAALEVMELTPAPVPSGFAFLGANRTSAPSSLHLRQTPREPRALIAEFQLPFSCPSVGRGSAERLLLRVITAATSCPGQLGCVLRG